VAVKANAIIVADGVTLALLLLSIVAVVVGLVSVLSAMALAEHNFL
jgi:hypothetical protein